MREPTTTSCNDLIFLNVQTSSKDSNKGDKECADRDLAPMWFRMEPRVLRACYKRKCASLIYAICMLSIWQGSKALKIQRCDFWWRFQLLEQPDFIARRRLSAVCNQNLRVWPSRICSLGSCPTHSLSHPPLLLNLSTKTYPYNWRPFTYL